jgi:hypothetical protein
VLPDFFAADDRRRGKRVEMTRANQRKVPSSKNLSALFRLSRPTNRPVQRIKPDFSSHQITNIADILDTSLPAQIADFNLLHGGEQREVS